MMERRSFKKAVSIYLEQIIMYPRESWGLIRWPGPRSYSVARLPMDDSNREDLRRYKGVIISAASKWELAAIGERMAKFYDGSDENVTASEGV